MFCRSIVKIWKRRSIFILCVHCCLIRWKSPFSWINSFVLCFPYRVSNSKVGKSAFIHDVDWFIGMSGKIIEVSIWGQRINRKTLPKSVFQLNYRVFDQQRQRQINLSFQSIRNFQENLTSSWSWFLAEFFGDIFKVQTISISINLKLDYFATDPIVVFIGDF